MGPSDSAPNFEERGCIWKEIAQIIGKGMRLVSGIIGGIVEVLLAYILTQPVTDRFFDRLFSMNSRSELH